MNVVKLKMLSLAVLLISSTAMALDNPASFNFDGVLLNDPAGTPMAGPLTVKFQIYDPSGGCLLFEETHTGVNPDTTTGAFSAKVGSGSRSSSGVDGGLAWKTLFANKGLLRSSSSPNCSLGYSPLTNDGRKLRITVGATTLTPDFQIASTPFATVADSVQGYEPQDFVSATATNVRIYNGGNYVQISAPALGVNVPFVLPPNVGTNGYVLQTDGAGTLNWVAPSGGGLSLAGGTMTGAINMNGNNLTATGHVTMSPQTTLNLGTYSSAQEATLVTGLTGVDKGKTWFNSTTNQLMYYDGTTARPVARDVSDIQSAPGKYLTYMPNNTACAGGEFLQWSGANLRWECGTAAGGITALTGDVAASGSGSVAATITANAVTSGKIANDAIASSKINSVGVAINRLLITDPTTGNTIEYADGCTIGEVLKWSASGWICSADSNSDSVVSVAGRTGAVALDVADIGSGAGKYFTYLPNNIACGNNELMQWNTANTRWQCSTLTFLTHGGNSTGANINVGTTDAFALNLMTNNTTQMTVSSTGNVGIGNSSPTTLLQVGGSPTAAINAMVFGATESRIYSSVLAPALVLSNVYNGANAGTSLNFAQNNSSSAQKTAAQISGFLTAIAPASEEGHLTFSTMSGGTLTEKMRIDMAGNVGIGTLAPTTTLDVYGDARIAGDLNLGNAVAGCSGPKEGSIRYNSGPKTIELCNGTAWVTVPMGSSTTFAGLTTDAGVLTTTTYYTFPVGPSQVAGGSPSTTDYPGKTRNLINKSGFIKGLYIKTSQTIPGTVGWVYVLVKNGTDTAVTCTVGVGLDTCNSGGASIAVGPGDEIGMKIVTGDSGASNRSSWAFDLASP